MITEEEKQEIIDRAAEKTLLLLPEVINNLWKQKIDMQRMAKKFYEDNPEFDKHRDIVGTVLEKLDADNPGIQYTKLLEKATSEINRMIEQSGKCSQSILSQPPQVNGEL